MDFYSAASSRPFTHGQISLAYTYCFTELCKGIVCPGQGEVCTFDKYHRAVCECPSECPPDTPNSPVCGSDGVTYENECEMNMSACVTGDWIDVVNQGQCLPPTQKSKYAELCSQLE